MSEQDKGIDPKVLQEYVATANNKKYGGDWNVINSKFPEFGTNGVGAPKPSGSVKPTITPPQSTTTSPQPSTGGLSGALKSGLSKSTVNTTNQGSVQSDPALALQQALQGANTVLNQSGGKGFTGEIATPQSSASFGGQVTDGRKGIKLETIFDKQPLPSGTQTFGQQVDREPTFAPNMMRSDVASGISETIDDIEASKQLELSAIPESETKIRADIEARYDAQIKKKQISSEGLNKLQEKAVEETFTKPLPIASESEKEKAKGIIDNALLSTNQIGTSFSEVGEKILEENKSIAMSKYENLANRDINKWAEITGEEVSEEDLVDIRAFQDFTKKTLPRDLSNDEKLTLLTEEYRRLDSKIKSNQQRKEDLYQAAFKDKDVNDIIYEEKKKIVDDGLIDNLPSGMRGFTQEIWDSTSEMRDLMSQYYDPTGRKGFTIKDGQIDVSGITDPKLVTYLTDKVGKLTSGYEKMMRDNYATYEDELYPKRQLSKNLSDKISEAEKALKGLDKNDPNRARLVSALNSAKKDYAAISSEISEADKWKSAVFLTEPNKLLAGISGELSDSKSAQAAFSSGISGESPYRQFENAYRMLSEENERLRIEGGFDASALDQIGQNIRSWTDWGGAFSLSEKEKEYLANRRIINSLTPIFLNNNSGVTEKSANFFESFLSGASSFLAPETSDRHMTETKVEATALGFIKEKGFGSESFTDAKFTDKMEERIDDIPWYSFESTGDMMGTVGAVMLDLTVSNAVVMNPALSLARKNEFLASLGNTYTSVLNSTKLGRFMAPAIEQATQFEVAGTVFGSAEDELDFKSGLAGAMGGELVSKVFSKIPTENLYSWTKGIFGSNTDKAVSILKKVGKAGSRGVGEVSEETMETLTQIYNDELRERGFWEEVQANFGDYDDNMKFFLGSFMMGSAFSMAESKKATEAYNKMTPEQKQEVDRVKEQIGADLAEASSSTIKQANKTKDVQEAITKASETEEASAISKVEIKNDGSNEVEYKVDGGFHSEKEFSEKLDDPDFVSKVENGEVKVEVKNPSVAIESKINPEVKEVASEDGGIVEVASDAELVESVKKVDTTDSQSKVDNKPITESDYTPEAKGDTLSTKSEKVNNYQKQFIKNIEPETSSQAIMRDIMSGVKFLKSEVTRETGFGSENTSSGRIHGKEELGSKKTLYTTDAEKATTIDDFAMKLKDEYEYIFAGKETTDIRNEIIEILHLNETIDGIARTLRDEYSVGGKIYENAEDRMAASQHEFYAANYDFDEGVSSVVTDEELAALSDEDFNQKDSSFDEHIKNLTDEQITERYGKFEPSGEAAKPITEGKGKNGDKTGEIGKTGTEQTEGKVVDKSTKEKFNVAAKAIESIADKLSADMSKLHSSPLPIVQNVVSGALNIAAKTIRATGDVAQAIEDGVRHIKESDWYKSLSDSGKSSAEKMMRESIENASKEELKKAEKVSETTDTEIKKDRSFAKRLSPEIQEGLDSNAKKYIPITNQVTVEEANAIIEAKGNDVAMKDVLNMDNKMSPRVRITIGMELIKKFNAEGTDDAFYKAVEIADELSRYATSLGQAVQIFSLWDKLSAEGMLVGYKKKLDKARASLKDKQKGFYEGSKTGYKVGTKKASKKATDKVFGKDTPKIKKAKAFNMSKADLSKKKQEALKRLKDAIRKGGGLSSGGINTDALDALTDYGFYVFADGVRTFKEWVREMKKATGVTNEDALRDVWMNRKGPNGKTLDSLSNLASIEEITSEHFSESNDNSKLAEKLKNTFDIDDDLANGLADELTSEFNKIVKSERKREIEKRTTGRISPKVRKAIEAVSDSDSFNDSDIENKIEEAFGIIDLTDEHKSKIKDIIKERDSRPEGFLRDEATREVLSEFEKAGGVSKGDIFWSMWYASVLSGYETQLLNIGANALNIALESIVTAVEKAVISRDPKAIAYSMVGLFNGMKQGMNEFNQVLKSGSSPEKLKVKLEIKDTLENIDFKGGKMNPFNYYKYVGRFMTAIDTGAYMASKGMRKQEIAREIARKEGLRGKELSKRVSELLNNDVEAYNEAISQATSEIADIKSRDSKMTTREYNRLIKIRANEIIESSIDNEIIEKAREFAAFTTYNYNPSGVLGTVASMASQLGQKFPPFKFVVPFTRIVANVLNQQLDYFPPIGYARAFGVSPSSFFDGIKEKTSAKDVVDRNRKLIKATLGTVLMTGLYLIAKSYDDDDDPYFAVSGKGPSDFKKKNQLYSQGWKPYSIKIGNTWISYQYTPMGVGLSYVGNWLDNEKYKELEDTDFMTKSAFALQSSSSSVFEMSFLNGLNGLMSALTSTGDAEKVADNMYKTIGKTGTAFIPNLFKQIDKAYDPTVYETTTIKASIIKEIPFVKRMSDLKPRLNAFGQEVEKKGNRFYNKVTDDPVWLLMAKHELYAPSSSPDTKTLEGNLMTEDEFYKYTKEAGKIVYEYLKDNLEYVDGELSEYTDEEKSKFISKLFRSAKKDAKYLLE